MNRIKITAEETQQSILQFVSIFKTRAISLQPIEQDQLLSTIGVPMHSHRWLRDSVQMDLSTDLKHRNSLKQSTSMLMHPSEHKSKYRAEIPSLIDAQKPLDSAIAPFAQMLVNLSLQKPFVITQEDKKNKMFNQSFFTEQIDNEQLPARQTSIKQVSYAQTSKNSSFKSETSIKFLYSRPYELSPKSIKLMNKKTDNSDKHLSSSRTTVYKHRPNIKQVNMSLF